MATFLTWLVKPFKPSKLITDESSEDVTNNPENNSKSQIKSSHKNKLPQKGVKVRQRYKKSNEEPAFNTSLNTPIEDIIEETINEEDKSQKLEEITKKKGKAKKLAKGGEDLQEKINITNSEDNIGYSFFNLKNITKVNTENKDDKKRKSSKAELNEVSFEDDLGFSFLPVKEKGKKYKNKSIEATVTDLTIKEKKNPSIIDHYQSRKITEFSSNQTLQNESKEFIKKSKNPQPYLSISEHNKLESKESKKVSSSISYASVVVNNFEELSLKPGYNYVETNKCVPSEEINSKSVTKDIEYPIDCNQSLIKQASDSNSSSLEVLNESTEIEDTHRIESSNNFEFIEKKCIDSCQDFHQILAESSKNRSSSSKHSSICIIDNQEDFDDFEGFSTDQQSTDNPLIDIRFGQEVESDNIIEKSIDSVCFVSFQKEEKTGTSTDSANSYFSEEFENTSTSYSSLQQNSTETQNKTFINDYLNENNYNSLNTNNFESTENYSVQTKSISLGDTNQTDLNGIEQFQKYTEEEESTHIPFKETNNFIKEDKAEVTTPTDLRKEEEEQTTVKIVGECFNGIKPIEHSIKNKQQFQDNLEEIKLDDKMQQTRVLTLNDHEHQECTLYRIEKNWIIQFRIGPSLFGRKVYLYCNYPTKTNNKLNEFKRNSYHLIEWETEEGCENADDTAVYTQIKAEIAGSFHYYFTYEKGENFERQGSGYFLVDPILKFGNNDDLPLDCIQCQTVLAKSLGSFSTWEQKLLVSKESGYNVIHFTPIQELGESNSSYSLSEQLNLNPVFKKSNGQMPTFKEIEQFVSKMRKDWKVASICDIVLNHTANESKWIQEHPEVTYNCVNCPYMRPAYLLDAALEFFSREVKRGVFEDRGIPPEVNSEDHLNAIRYHFRASILDPLKIHEMFICDVNKYVADFLNLARSVSPVSPDSKQENRELKLIQDPEFRKLSATIDMDLALKIYNVYRNDTFDEESRLKRCAEQFKNKLDTLNNDVIFEINDDLSAAIENVIAGIRYFRRRRSAREN